MLRLDTPAGLVIAEYRQEGQYVEEVRITNVPSFLYAEGLTVECPVLGEISVDVAYGGNFYAIVEPQANYRDMADYSAGDLVAWSPIVRQRLNEKYSFEHPENPDINRLSHMLWTGPADAAGIGRAQRRVLRRQGDRPIALRHRHVGAHGAASRQGQAEGGRQLRARIDHRFAVPRARREGGRVDRQDGDHPVDRRLGAHDRVKHDHHRRP